MDLDGRLYPLVCKVHYYTVLDHCLTCALWKRDSGLHKMIFQNDPNHLTNILQYNFPQNCIPLRDTIQAALGMPFLREEDLILLYLFSFCMKASFLFTNTLAKMKAASTTDMTIITTDNFFVCLWRFPSKSNMTWQPLVTLSPLASTACWTWLYAVQMVAAS